MKTYLGRTDQNSFDSRIFNVFFSASRGVSVLEDIATINQLSVKKKIIEQARQWPTYFCRLFPVTVRASIVVKCHTMRNFSLFKMPKYHEGNVQMLGISHSGIFFIKRNENKTNNDTLQVIETFAFDSIEQISVVRPGSTIGIRVEKKRLTVHSHRVIFHQMKSMRFESFH